VVLKRIPDARLEALAEAAEEYVKDAFGQQLKLVPAVTKNVPHFVFDRYRLWQGSLDGRTLALMVIREPRQGATTDYLKHRDLVRRELGVDLVLLLLDHSSNAIRRQMVDRKIGFIAPGAQLYVPEVFLDLRERAPSFAIAHSDQISPTTQFMLLAILQDVELENRNLTELADQLRVSIMSISRSLDELEALGFAKARYVGRQRRLHMLLGARELWDAAQARFQTPVRKVRHVNFPDGRKIGPLAGESALAQHTMLAAPRVETRAVLSASWKRLADELVLVPSAPFDEDRVEVQTWTYDPQVLAQKTGAGREAVIDRLSLYLSVRASPDERVVQAADELLATIGW
jgi:DNA-binding MarR family transcriptional regulator